MRRVVVSVAAERQAIRYGMSAREAAERFEERAESIVADDRADVAEIERVGNLTWRWQIGDVESARLQFKDAGVGHGEAEVDLSRSDASAAERIRSVVDGLIGVLAMGPSLDPPAVARDPHQGEPPEESTDPDQPL